MKVKTNLSQNDKAFLKKVNLEISIGFLHILHLKRSIPFKDVREIQITRPHQSILKYLLKIILRAFEFRKGSHIPGKFDGTRQDTIRTIEINLFNEKTISYEVKNIDSISTGKVFKKLFSSTYINNTSIEE